MYILWLFIHVMAYIDAITINLQLVCSALHQHEQYEWSYQWRQQGACIIPHGERYEQRRAAWTGELSSDMRLHVLCHDLVCAHDTMVTGDGDVT